MRISLEKGFEVINKINEGPGCYIFENSKEEVIYIGKAKNLKKRVNSYFFFNKIEEASINNFEKKRIFFDQIKYLNFIVTDNEKEALILEQNLIKKYKPRFNILLKDDRYYPYLEITNEINPRYKISYNINKRKKNSDVFGPFPDGSKAKEIMQILENFFPLAKCKNKKEDNGEKKPCFYYSINRCSGYCFKYIDNEYYLKVKKEVKNFFRGDVREIKRKLEKNIEKNIKNFSFELAKREKKILDCIDFLVKKQNIVFNKREDNDFIEFYLKDNIISFYLLIYRYGVLVNSNEGVFFLWDNDLNSSLTTYLYQFYQNNSLPSNLYISDKIDTNNLKLLNNFFSFSCKIAKSGRKKEILNLAKKNAFENWQRNYFNNFKKTKDEELLLKLALFFSIESANKIHFIDISNIFNEDIVAGFLTIINAKKEIFKSKLYKINSKDVVQESDIARINHSCLIHYNKFSQDLMPNLIIVDGSKEQIKSVKSALKVLNLNSKVIGLAKNDKHLTEKIVDIDKNKEIFINKIDSDLKDFFCKYQEEVHKYAINFHRKIHLKKVISK